MRRKIEKYLATKQGVDENNIRYTEDGRFDFMNDLTGVLNAVRGRDSSGKKLSRADRSRSAKKSSTASFSLLTDLTGANSSKCMPYTVTMSDMAIIHRRPLTLETLISSSLFTPLLIKNSIIKKSLLLDA